MVERVNYVGRRVGNYRLVQLLGTGGFAEVYQGVHIHLNTQVAEALQHAHDQRLVHRDVKPENMLLCRSNEALLSDFGIALAAQSSQYQSTQNVAGTIGYMAPEQIQAHPRPASDQYSLGVVVYEWLSGERPFQGSFTEIAVKHAMVMPAPCVVAGRTLHRDRRFRRYGGRLRSSKRQSNHNLHRTYRRHPGPGVVAR